MAMDFASVEFIKTAINHLYTATDQYGVVPQATIVRIQNVIEELESILEEEC